MLREVVVSPMKSRPGVKCAGPRYHQSTYRASNGLLLPLHTPSANARLGMNNTAMVQANSPCQSPLMSSRTANPLPVRRAKAAPAAQIAGSCRMSAIGEEKIKAPVECCASRQPVFDHNNIGHIQATSRNTWRACSSGDSTVPNHKPTAPAYHHQRRPLSISRNSEMINATKRLVVADLASGVRCTCKEIA